MEPAKVYFTNFRTSLGENLLGKLTRLMKTAGLGELGLKGKFTALKLHFGEPGNLAYLRPNFLKCIADFVRECGGKPILTDCNTLYVGGRKNALDHMDSANENGFLTATTGCQIIIGDGLKGTDDVDVPVRGGVYCKTAHIGRAVMDADAVISVTHFKCHEQTGCGGALKNLGMGCGSRAGKMDMHADGKPYVDPDRCLGCGTCQTVCAHGAPNLNPGGVMEIDQSRCVGCGRCIGVCPADAVCSANDASIQHLCA